MKHALPKKSLDNNVLYALALTTLILAGLFLRVWNLGVPSFWVDEVNTVFTAQSFNETGELKMPSGGDYGRARLLTYIVSLFYQLFGISEATSRLPSALFGILSIIAIYWLAKIVFNRQIALVTVFLMTFSHFEVGWSRIARMYSILQFFSILIVLCFILVFEKNKHAFLKEKIFKGEFKLYIPSPSLILGLVTLSVLSYMAISMIHYLAIFLFVGIGVYLVSIAVYKLMQKEVVNKYVITVGTILLSALLIWATVPIFRQKVMYFLQYTPSWVSETTWAYSRNRLFDFLISEYRFPLAAFFAIGAVQTFTRGNKLGLLLVWIFLTPLFLLTFVFLYRVPVYIYYVYPFFLMISAYGLVNIIEGENVALDRSKVFKNRWLKYSILSMFFLSFILSPWFRLTLKIPFTGDGYTNMAVTHNEWKQATSIVNEKKKNKDIVITSLPQMTLYYNLPADYGLNWSNLKLSIEKEFRNSQGELSDVYAGVKCIESLDELENIVQDNNSGWIIVSKYHFENAPVIPHDVKNYLLTKFPEIIKTDNGSVLIFRWAMTTGENL